MMNPFINEMMVRGGTVKLDVEIKVFGEVKPSRGYYIVEPGGRFYLHHDGKVKDGVHAGSDKPAFWDTEESADSFLNKWKLQQNLQSSPE